MLIKIKHSSCIAESEVTDYRIYKRRREFIKKTALGAAALGLGLPSISQAGLNIHDYKRDSSNPLAKQLTKEVKITSYNNFYELGTGKSDPKANAHLLKTDPWAIRVEGECEKPGVLGLEEFVCDHQLEERIYRLRCVETWSMVVPWLGVPLAPVLKRFQPASNARYVEFTTLYDPDNLPGQRRSILDWPYQEGLRIDEAMHPLSLLAVGLYGKTLPAQNGAPLRLVVPWKYGFKSIKSIVKIRFSRQQPQTSWNISAPDEYGFYANVNPRVDHPRWSQQRERRIGQLRKRKTLMFNGYADQVAALYAGMDLRQHF